MAQDKSQSTSNVEGHSFNKGLIKDVDDSYIPEGAYSHARNATEYTSTGNLNTRSNEPSNLFCAQAPYTIIGTIHLYGDLWSMYSTNDVDSEIGYFDDSECKYTKVVNDPCLGFKREFLIKGVSKQNFDCTWQVYWADGNMPDRTMTMDKPPFKETCVTVDSCVICTPTTELDCDAIRLAKLTITPCVNVSRGKNGGNLQNGSYFVVIAYTINGQRVTDYFGPSNVQSLFEHDNLSGSLDITLNQMDTTHFDEFELVIVRTINQQTSAKRIGLYSTRLNQIFIDYINEALVSIPIELIPIRTPFYEKSDAIYEVSDYMLRVGPSTRFDFNYQPLANRIKAKWVSVEYPSDYYRKGGNVTSYLRDEVYPFFIRWVYVTGDRSSSYHIPGRAPQPFEIANAAINQDAIEFITPAPNNYIPKYWEVNNTATTTSTITSVQADGGKILAEGDMGYWESSEVYPDKQPEIWNASAHTWSNIFPAVDLCGKAIRHHKMPDNLTHPTTNHINIGATTIRVLGVKFQDIRIPVDNNGVAIPGIVGWEILRGSREGNKTVVAKGMINNMREYNIPGSGKQGLYQNYPYNPLGPDPTLSATEAQGGFQPLFLPPATAFRQDVFTFHSPDTQFRNPFLSAKELKLYGEIAGFVQGNFEDVPDHPKEKLMKDIGLIVSALIGIGAAIVAMRGRRTVQRTAPTVNNIGLVMAGTTTGAAPIDLGVSGQVAEVALFAALNPLEATGNTLINVLASSVTPNDQVDNLTKTAQLSGFGVIPGMQSYTETTTIELPDSAMQSPVIKALTGLVTFSHYFTLGTDTAFRLIESLVPFTQYAYRYKSHGFYENFGRGNVIAGNQRRLIQEASYVENQFEDFGASFRINNLYRGRAVAIQTSVALSNPANPDNTIQSIGTAVNNGFLTDFKATNVKDTFNTVAASYYAALKIKIHNQYGQIGSIQEIPISCVYNTDLTVLDQVTPVVFGGDTYITRYTEKNTFFYFYDWLLGQPDGYEFDYRLRYMLNFPRYWADFTHFETGEFLSGLVTSIVSNPLSLFSNFPSGKAALDKDPDPPFITGLFQALQFRMKNAYFYLFQSGVRDFFVESEINTDLRDWGNDDSERHYDPYRYADLSALFAPKIIKAGNFFKYDISLSISRLFINFISWGNMQPRDYDPLTAENCFSSYPFRVIYSLPQSLENKKDYWRVFLANNYRDFKSKVTAIKSINKNGAILLFETDSPIMFQGVDTLQTDLETKITIGDGGLFTQPLQSVVNTDDSLEYGSCQNRLSVLNTPFGLYWMCENQGKVFQMTGNIKDITFSGLKFWFKKYLPYFLLQDFPTFQLTDNPVIGIGCQSVYDNQIETIYFCKRDFKLRTDIPDTVVYLSGNRFMVNGILNIELGDPRFFEDSSWTVSYNPKDGSWISFHDWHPGLLIPSKNDFLSIKDNTIWRHNFRTDSFCNYYGVDYPFELEYVTSTGTVVNALRSLEYYLECYKYDATGINKFHLLDYNFDQAVVSNTEQVSGELNLKLSPKNSVSGLLQYPIINGNSIDILYTKEEQKYRFNQFWDITDDRGEFTTAQRVIWLNDSSGYKRILNPLNLNYNKASLQRKKFRHYLNHVILRKRVCGEIKMIMKVATNKQVVSFR